MAPAFHTPRRKDTESDMRTLTQDIPVMAMFVVPLIMVGVWFGNRAMAAGVDSSLSSWVASWQFWTVITTALGAIWAWRRGRILWALLAVLAASYILWSFSENTETAVKPAAIDTPSERHAEVAPPTHLPVTSSPVTSPPPFDYRPLTADEAKAADHAAAMRIAEALKRVATHNDNHAGINARIIVFDDPLKALLPAEPVEVLEPEPATAQEEPVPAVEAPPPPRPYVAPEQPTRARRQEARSGGYIYLPPNYTPDEGYIDGRRYPVDAPPSCDPDHRHTRRANYRP